MSYIGNQPVYQAFVTDQFSGNGSTTAFTMSVAPANTASVLVAVSGVLQDPSTYSVSGTTLTFSAAPPSGTGNISARYLGIPASGVTTTAYRTVTEFTATAGQTTFTPPSYTAGYINVYRNGVLLGSADYTATNGTTVVLTSGATAGDTVTTESFYVSSVVNAIPAQANAVSQTYLATNIGATGPAFRAYLNADQTVSSGVLTKCTLDVESFDTNSNFASSRFTPSIAGYYEINCSMRFTSSGASMTNCLVEIIKNGSEYSRVAQSNGATFTGNFAIAGSDTVYLNGSTDYVEMWGLVTGSGTVAFNAPASYVTCTMSGSLARAA